MKTSILSILLLFSFQSFAGTAKHLVCMTPEFQADLDVKLSARNLVEVVLTQPNGEEVTYDSSANKSDVIVEESGKFSAVVSIPGSSDSESIGVVVATPLSESGKYKLVFVVGSKMTQTTCTAQ